VQTHSPTSTQVRNVLLSVLLVGTMFYQTAVQRWFRSRNEKKGNRLMNLLFRQGLCWTHWDSPTCCLSQGYQQNIEESMMNIFTY